MVFEFTVQVVPFVRALVFFHGAVTAAHLVFPDVVRSFFVRSLAKVRIRLGQPVLAGKSSGLVIFHLIDDCFLIVVKGHSEDCACEGFPCGSVSYVPRSIHPICHLIELLLVPGYDCCQSAWLVVRPCATLGALSNPIVVRFGCLELSSCGVVQGLLEGSCATAVRAGSDIQPSHDVIIAMITAVNINTMPPITPPSPASMSMSMNLSTIICRLPSAHRAVFCLAVDMEATAFTFERSVIAEPFGSIVRLKS